MTVPWRLKIWASVSSSSFEIPCHLFYTEAGEGRALLATGVGDVAGEGASEYGDGVGEARGV